MTTTRAWVTTAALAAIGAGTIIVQVPTTPAAATGCITANTPPDPPPRGAVLWMPPDGNSDGNTAVVNFGDSMGPDNCFAVENPYVIKVAPGGALVFHGIDGSNSQDDLVSPWGAVSDTTGSALIEIVPGTWGNWEDWEGVSSVEVVDPATSVSRYGSCRQCDFSNATVTFTGFPGDTIVGFARDVSATKWNGATVTGDGGGFDFSGADLSGGTFKANVTDATFVSVTANDTTFAGSQLQGATFGPVQFEVQSPPSFAGATLGGDLSCTSIAETNLLGVSFADTAWDAGCTGPSFPGSQVSLLALQDLLVGAEAPALDLSGAQVIADAADRTALAGADLTGVSLVGDSNTQFLGEALDLTATKLDGASLTGLTFDLAQLTGASFTNVSAANASFVGADLSGTGSLASANFSGANTNLQGADFGDANISGASFVGADITGAQFTGARGVETDFSGVRANSAAFTDAHLYGNGQAFDDATDMQNVDFTGAVLAGDAGESGGFDLTGADLTGAHFDGAVCVGCNLTNTTLDRATFIGAYLPGVGLSGATLTGASFARAWLYCGSVDNNGCPFDSTSQLWSWPLALGSGEASGAVPFADTDLTGVTLADVEACPDGEKPAGTPPSCDEQLLPKTDDAPTLPAPCSATFRGACPTATSTLFQSSATTSPLAVASIPPPTWNTPPTEPGYYVGLDDATIRVIGDDSASVVAGTSGTECATATSPCGDGGASANALLGQPSGLAVGLDGSVYVADSELLRVRKIDPSGTITTIAGTGASCSMAPCGDDGPASSAQLAAANAVAVDTHGVVLIADGAAGVRRVATDGTITTLAPGTASGYVVSLVASAAGPIYATTRSPDLIIRIDPTTGAVTTVVGTGTPGYNGNVAVIDGQQFLVPGTQVQVDEPTGLSVDLDGNVLFADTGNHLIRAYNPTTTYVIDDLAGSIVNGAPQGGFNGDGQWATDTQLSRPLGVAATGGALLVVADTGNQRVRQVGPGPLDIGEPASPNAPTTMVWVPVGGPYVGDPAVVTTGGPSPCRQRTSVVFAVAPSGAPAFHERSGGGWSAAIPLGGLLDSDVTPAQTLDRVGRHDFEVFGIGVDGAMWYRTRVSGWRSLGGAFHSQPIAVRFEGRSYVFAVGVDDGVWYRTPSTGWANLGGLIGSDLAVTTDGDSLYVAGVGGDQALWTRRLTGSTWSGWQSLGGAVTSPAAGTFDDVTGTGYLFAVGADGAIWYQGVTGGVWSGWYGVGGLAASTPAVVARAGGLDVYVVGIDLAKWQQRWNGTTWSGWQGHGGGFTSNPVATTTHVMALGLDGWLYSGRIT